MTRLKKLGRRLLSLAISAALACTTFGVYASADNIYANIGADLFVAIDTPHTYYTDNDAEASYPSLAYSDDLAITYTVGGTEYNAVLVSVKGSTRIYGIMGTSDKSGTLSLTRSPDGYTYVFSGGSTTTSVSSWGHPYANCVKGDPEWDAQYALLSAEDKAMADTLGAISYEVTDKYYAQFTATMNVAAGYGFSIYNKSMGDKPNLITDAQLYDGDTFVTSGVVTEGYMVSFSGVKLNKSYTLKVLYFDVDNSYALRIGTMTWTPREYSSPQTEWHLFSEFDWELGDSLSVDELSDFETDGSGDDIVWGSEEGLYDSEFRVAVRSELSKYDTTVAGIDTFAAVSGKATENFVDNNDRMGVAVGDTVVWQRFDMSKTAGVRVFVEAGTYTLSGSDQLILNYSGDFKIGSNEKKDIELTVEPKYTLNITSKAGIIDCTVDGYSFTGVESQDIALIGDAPVTVVDNDSGKVYRVTATDDNAHIKLVLGSDDYLADGTGGTGFTDDVPKTADPIVVISLIFVAILCAFAISFFFVYRANKKKGDA